MRLLLVEDNRELSDWLARLLRKSNYAVDCAFTGEEALDAAATGDHDLIIVDLGLPTIDGIEVVKSIRSNGLDMPIVILTAVDTVTSRVRGLDQGADDYLVKPFEISELEARIRVHLRRRDGHAVPRISFARLNLNMVQRQVSLGTEALPLTAREYAVLEALMLRAGEAIAKSTLFESIYGADEEAAPNALEVCVHRLRKKIESSGARIETLRGTGYVLRIDSGPAGS